MISVFSDRIEILSRGTIPTGQTLEGFFAGESVPVNQKLSEIFLQLHISEKTGRGVPKVVEKYGKEAYQFRENTILVTIPFRWIHVVDAGNAPEEIKQDCLNFAKIQDKNAFHSEKFDVNEESIQKSNQKSNQKVLDAIKNNNQITINELIDKIGLSESGIKRILRNLKKENKIKRVGADKGGYWEVIDT